MSLVLGIDAAWSEKNPSGVALVSTGTDRPRLIRAAPSFEDFVLGTAPDAWCGKHASRASVPDILRTAKEIGDGAITVVAVDMPLAHTPISARRRCDNAVSEAFGARGCSTHSPTEQRPGKLSEMFHRQAKAAGFALKTSASGMDGPALLEVYPHMALLTLCSAERRLPYKLSRRSKNFPDRDHASRLEVVRAEWNKILARLNRHIDLHLEIDCAGKTLRHWKAWEDVIDAVVCCWVGLEWLAGRAKPYGDDCAAIWVPATSPLDGIADVA